MTGQDTRERRRARRRLERAVCAGLFVVPLAINPWGQAPGGAVKDATMWIVAAALAWSLVTYASRNTVPLVARRLWVPAALWLCALILTTCTAAVRPSSAWAALNVVPFVLVGFSAAVVAARPSGRRRVMDAWLASAGVAAAYAILQHYALPPSLWLDQPATTRSWGTVGQPTFLAAFLAMALPFALVGLGRQRGYPWRMASAGAIIVALTATYSRAGWVAAALGFAVALLAGRHAWNSRLLRRVASVAVVGIALSLTMVATDHLRPDNSQFDRFNQFEQGTDKSVTERALFLRMAGQAIRARPWLGWGPDSFRVIAPIYDRDKSSLAFPLAWPHANTHNEFFTAALDGGLLGLLAWGAVILMLTSAASDATRQGSGSGKSRMAVVYGSMVAFMVQGLATPRPPVTTLGLALCWGLVAGMTAERRRERRAERHAAISFQWAGVATRGGAVACLALGICLLAADVLGFSGIQARREGRLAEAINDFHIASRLYPMEMDMRRLWGETAMEQAGKSDGSERVASAQSAAEAFGANVAVEPRNGFWRAGLAQALSYYDVAAARRQVDLAKQLYPQSSRVCFADSVVCRAEGRPKAEEAALRAAAEEGSTEPEPYIRLAEIFRAQGRADFADKLLAYAANIWIQREDLAPWRPREQAQARP